MNRLLDRNNLILNLLYFLMVFSLIYVVGIVIYLDLPFLDQVIFAFLITMGVKFIMKNSIVLYISIIILSIGGFVVNSYIASIHPYFERFIVLFQDIYEHIFMNQVLQEENILPFWVLVTVIYSIFTSLIIFRPKEKLFSLLLLYLPLFIYYWYVYVNEAYFALVIFLFAYFILNGISNYKKENSNVEVELKEQFSRLSPFWNKTTVIYSIIIVAVALILPKSDNNIKWPWMEDQIASIIPRVESMRSSDIGSREGGTGFQQSPSRLGGPISQGNRLIMYVRSDGPTYLRGAVRNHYDGNIWDTMTLNNDTSTHLLESNFSNMDYYERERYYEEKDVIVQFIDYSSTTLFSPYMPIVVNAHSGDQINLTQDHIIELPEGINDGETYGVKVLEAKPYAELLELGINNRYEDIENMDLLLQVPSESLTQRTLDLKDEIVSRIDSDFEKALAIESYLRENYHYTLDTSPVPEGHEFIDYFLFEEEAGYCTYYATTMAMFLRLEGIPSRYVEGYIAQDTSDGIIYEVRESHAHAWVEAYIEPVGWMTFEPTSAYSLDDRELNIAEEFEEEEIQQDDTIVEDSLDPEEETTLEVNMEVDKEETVSENNKDSKFSRNMVLIILGIILIIIPIIFLVRIIKYKVHEYRIKQLPNFNRMIILYERILELTEKLGYPKNHGETHYEYSNRIGYEFEELRELTKIFVKNKYGDSIPSDEELEKFIDYYEVLEKQLKNHLGRFKYYLKKY